MKITIVAVSISALVSSAAFASQEESARTSHLYDAAEYTAAFALSTQPAAGIFEFTVTEISALNDIDEECLRDEMNVPTCD